MSTCKAGFSYYKTDRYLTHTDVIVDVKLTVTVASSPSGT